MFEFLKPAPRPVIDALEKHEVVFARGQKEYMELRALRANTRDHRTMSRWALTPELRQAIAEGADIFITQLPFDQQLQPISVAIGDDPDPAYFRQTFNVGRDKLSLNFVVFGKSVRIEASARLSFDWWIVDALVESGRSNEVLTTELELRTMAGELVDQHCCPEELACRDDDQFVVSRPEGVAG